MPGGMFQATLAGSRVNFTVTPRLLLAGLFQFNSTSRTFDSNVRLRWEYRPGSECFLVFSEGRLTDTGVPLRNRTLAIKATRLLRF